MASEKEMELQAQVAELEAQIEHIRTSQAGSDKTVTRLQAENAELQQKLEAATEKAEDEKTDAEKKAADREALLNRRERVFNLAIEKNIDPKTAFSLLGLTDESDAEKLENAAEREKEIRQAAINEFMKDNGRIPHKSVRLRTEPMTLQEIAKLPADVQAGLAPEVTNQAVDRHLEEKKKGKSTRAWLSKTFSGGE